MIKQALQQLAAEKDAAKLKERPRAARDAGGAGAAPDEEGLRPPRDEGARAPRGARGRRGEEVRSRTVKTMKNLVRTSALALLGALLLAPRRRESRPTPTS